MQRGGVNNVLGQLIHRPNGVCIHPVSEQQALWLGVAHVVLESTGVNVKGVTKAKCGGEELRCGILKSSLATTKPLQAHFMTHEDQSGEV